MLNPEDIRNGVYQIFTVPYEPANMREFAKKLTKVYSDYAKKAMTYAGNPIIKHDDSVMENILVLLDSPANTADIFANTVEKSVIAWWGIVVFAAFPFPPGFGLVTSVTHTVPKNSSIAPGILADTLAPGTPETKAATYASIFHSATLGVMSSHFGLDITLLAPKTEIDKPIM